MRSVPKSHRADACVTGPGVPDEVDRLVSVICDRIYSSHYKTRDEYYILALITHATSEDMSNVSEPTDMLSQVPWLRAHLAAHLVR